MRQSFKDTPWMLPGEAAELVFAAALGSDDAMTELRQLEVMGVLPFTVEQLLDIAAETLMETVHGLSHAKTQK